MGEIMNEKMQLRQEEYDKIEAELEELVSVKRAEVAERIKEAISYGDISENAEYDSAKNEQAELEERIYELEEMLRTAEIVQDEDVKGDTVNIGLKVFVKDEDTGEKEEFYIVGATGSDPFSGKISTESPVGKALIGKKKGDKVAVEIKIGENVEIINYKILKMEKY